MKNANQILDIIIAETQDLHDIKNALENGATLAALGITDEDQDAVEEAYAMVMLGEVSV